MWHGSTARCPPDIACGIGSTQTSNYAACHRRSANARGAGILSSTGARCDCPCRPGSLAGAGDTMKFVLGVDGGNTKTLVLIARDDGVILGAGRAGCSDIYSASSVNAAIGEIEGAVEAALTKAGIQPSELAAGAFSRSEE